MKVTGLGIVLIFILGGCETTFDAPVTVEMRRVTGIGNSNQAIVIKSDMKFEDGRPVSRILRLPKGIYRLEAQDAAYQFYLSEQGIEIRHLTKEEGNFTTNELKGGLMIRKQMFSWEDGDYDHLPPAAVYLDGGTDKTRYAIRALNNDFLRQRGFAWKKTKMTLSQSVATSP